MKNIIKSMSIKKHDQIYLHKIMRIYPKISSGRKNYIDQYYTVLKNILLSQAYNEIINHESFFQKKFLFKEKDNFLSIKFKLQ